MLLRFVIKNLYSFKGETEFNLFPSSRATHHLHHKIQCGHAEALRFSAIYGANGAGKSNLIKAISDLRRIILRGSIAGNVLQLYKFQLSDTCLNEPVSVAIEFFFEGIVYYYSIEFDTNRINYESLSISEKEKDRLVFERTSNGTQTVSFGKDYLKDKKNVLFSRVLEEKLLKKDDLLLSFMAVNYPEEIKGIKEAYFWFLDYLIIVNSDGLKNLTIAHFLDTDPKMLKLLRDFLPGMKTGISSLSIISTVMDEDKIPPDWINELKTNPGNALVVPSSVDSRITASVVYENGRIVLKEIQPSHLRNDGAEVKMPINFESDGTIRLIEYTPVLYHILNQDCTVLIDEVERSLHPILIKEIITKLSESETAKGQLVFTTHESCLLDQDILRPDEIWFAQKDQDQATQLYPLSDFNIHKTANIENGYLNGRYGGIPFLSNLKDLHW